MALKGSRAMETLAPRERTGVEDREGYTMHEGEIGKGGGRSAEETRKGAGAIAPTLGKFGVTRGDEDKSRSWMRLGWRGEKGERKRGSKRGRDHRPQGRCYALANDEDIED
ncbi:hypothetical protein DBV15_10361 [Temnothorax longispinosus]|uniref:Uncharacterized protein n=1 Tax=Temnothorax longispinosus TaxID=300112 RepID=A0A4V3SBH4_9HYME|nr:hypothetical protein DBV15_10361 [Temnothorax longispinosus]